MAPKFTLLLFVNCEYVCGLDVLQEQDAVLISSPALIARALIVEGSAMVTMTVAVARTNSTVPREVTK